MNNDIILRMGTHTYVARIKRVNEDGGYYFVEFPSLKGCITYGYTMEEAIAMAKDVLKGYLTWLKEDGEEFPVEKYSLPRKSSMINIPISVSA